MENESIFHKYEMIDLKKQDKIKLILSRSSTREGLKQMNRQQSPAKPINISTEKNYFKTTPSIETEKDLRQIISTYPKMLDKRIQNTLDHLSIEFIEASQIVILGSCSKQNRMIPLQVSHQSLSIRDQQYFSFPKTNASSLIFNEVAPLYASLYFMAHGFGHGLRINGTIEETTTEAYLFKIEQVYFHCARAAARSAIWTKASAVDSRYLKKENFIEHAPFLLLKTRNQTGKTELSPRGDDAGFVKMLRPNTLLLPERPGNKIAVSLRNIIQHPEVELLFMIPSSDQTLSITGIAKIISDQELLEQCAVNGKKPKTGILIQIESTELQTHQVINKSQLWNQENKTKANITSFSKALSSHINGTGLLGKATSVVVDVVVKHDMKNLY